MLGRGLTPPLSNTMGSEQAGAAQVLMCAARIAGRRCVGRMCLSIENEPTSMIENAPTLAGIRLQGVGRPGIRP
jgi:hypothetical protein